MIECHLPWLWMQKLHDMWSHAHHSIRNDMLNIENDCPFFINKHNKFLQKQCCEQFTAMTQSFFAMQEVQHHLTDRVENGKGAYLASLM